ncbi:hypothetical protein [Sporomusa sphaeroides]
MPLLFTSSNYFIGILPRSKAIEQQWQHLRKMLPLLLACCIVE